MTTKIALITGGSRGLGKSAALKLAGQGVDVIVTYRSQEQEAAGVVTAIEAAGGKAAALRLDVGDSGSFAAFSDKLLSLLSDKWQRDSFDFLVNNAGIGTYASFADTTEAQFDELVDIHFKGVFLLTQQLAPLVADGGRILNVSTGLTRFALPGFAACEFPALRSHFVVGVKAPPDCRRNGATRFPALRRHAIVGVMAPPDCRR